jgi:hypothetical protein
MTELAQLAGAARTDVAALPGYNLSPWRLEEYADAEQEFSQRHLRAAAEAGIGLPREVSDRIIGLALADVKRGDFSWGTLNFDKQLFLASNVPFILWLTLRKKHPETKREAAAKLITEENRHVLHKAILELLGFDFTKKKTAPPPAAMTTHSPGEPSGTSSENDDSSFLPKSSP